MTTTPRTRSEIVFDHDREAEAMQQAWRETMWRHKRYGVPVVFWQDGKVVEVPAEEIPEEWCSRPEHAIWLG